VATAPNGARDLVKKGMCGMAEQFSEIIAGEKEVVDTLHSVIESRIVCKMGIPRTDQSWNTVLLEVRNVRNAYHLLIDSVRGFEAVLSKSPDKEVSLEFKDQVGVPCRFNTRIIACNPKAILAGIPETISRIQRRKYFRIEAPLGTEITFLDGSSTERKKAEVKDYSAGGVAFLPEKDLNFKVGDSLTDIHLSILEGGKRVRFRIPKAAVRRVELESSLTGKPLCAIEFTEIPGETRNGITSHVFRQQRMIMQRIGKALNT
jgi:c-di-GMP-binding flagellar brake protein YcgR